MNSGKPTLFVRLTVKLCRKINYSGDKYSYHWSRSLRKAFFGIYRDYEQINGNQTTPLCLLCHAVSSQVLQKTGGSPAMKWEVFPTVFSLGTYFTQDDPHSTIFPCRIEYSTI